jgi:XTP/dITP diphosphohydrolase
LKWVLASRNPDKVEEISKILDLSGLELMSLLDFPDIGEPVEDGLSLLENSLKKARFVRETLDLPAIADDTGLVVNGLHGMPGVFSSRYSGERATYADNRKKLLIDLKSTGGSDRRACFVCCATVLPPDSDPRFVFGRVDGLIIDEERGEGGFGYDPIFLYPPLGRTFAEIPLEMKNRISHRAIAFQRVREILETLL